MPSSDNLSINNKFSIGIDFGTTKSALAYTRLKDFRPQPAIGTLQAGIEFMPTVVFITADGKKLVGEKAEIVWRTQANNAQESSGQLLRDFKLQIGNAEFSSFLRRRFGLDGAYELAALVIYVLKSMAEGGELRDGGRITEAVITHPANWDNEQKEHLIRAANIAGIKNPILLKEPIAALYEVDRHRPLSSGWYNGSCVKVRERGILAGTIPH